MSGGLTRPPITLVNRQVMKLTSYCYLVLRLRMPVAIVHFPCPICLLGVQRDNLTYISTRRALESLPDIQLVNLPTLPDYNFLKKPLLDSILKYETSPESRHTLFSRSDFNITLSSTACSRKNFFQYVTPLCTRQPMNNQLNQCLK